MQICALFFYQVWRWKPPARLTDFLFLYGKHRNCKRSAEKAHPAPSFIIRADSPMRLRFSLRPAPPSFLPAVPGPVSVLCSRGERGGGGSGALRVYVFTMSEPQAAHATPTRPLMPWDQEQVVHIIPFRGFSTARPHAPLAGLKVEKYIFRAYEDCMSKYF